MLQYGCWCQLLGDKWEESNHGAPVDDLDMAGNYGIDVPKAFNAYLMEGDEGILDLIRSIPL